MSIIGLNVVSGQHLSSLRIKPKGRQRKTKALPNFSGSDIKLLCRLGVWASVGRVFDFFVITVGSGYL